MTEPCFDEYRPLANIDFSEQCVNIAFEYHTFGRFVEFCQAQGLGIGEFICQTLIDKVADIEQRITEPIPQNKFNLLHQDIDKLNEWANNCLRNIQDLNMKVNALNTLHGKVHAIENHLLDDAKEIALLSDSLAANRITTLTLCEHSLLTVDALREIFAHLGIEVVIKLPNITTEGGNNGKPRQ